MVALSVGAYALIRLVGPVEVWRRIERSLSVPCWQGTTIFKRVFRTANPTPCSLVSSSLLPCQKNVQSFSLNDPEPDKRVSCKVTMSTFSLASSSFITDVFLASLISLRSSDSPGVSVRTFQVPSLRIGVFLFVFLFKFVLVGA